MIRFSRYDFGPFFAHMASVKRMGLPLPVHQGSLGGSCTMKDMVVAQPNYASIFSAPSFLRIAIPSWRSIGIQYRPDPEPEPVSLSREEILALFDGDLRPKSQRRALTDWEQKEQSLSERMRAALYPGQSD